MNMQMPKLVLNTLTVALAASTAGAGAIALGIAAGFTSTSFLWPVASVCAVLGALLHDTKRSVTDMIDNRSQTLRDKTERLQRDVADIHGLVRLQPFCQQIPLPMGGGWALTGDSAALLVRESMLRRPRTIVELGSGVSTLLLGQILQKLGTGKIVSFDHDVQWAERTRRQVSFLGLDEFVTVIDAPLGQCSLEGQMFEWYVIPPAALAALGGAVDLLVVDGPPQSPQQSRPARYPALPMLASCLSSQAWIFVDDAKRQTEREMVKLWTRQMPGWQTHDVDTVDGVCLMTRQ